MPDVNMETAAALAVYNRIRKWESEDVTLRIVKYIGLLENGHSQMMRLALVPDPVIQMDVHQAKIKLGIPVSPSFHFTPSLPPMYHNHLNNYHPYLDMEKPLEPVNDCTSSLSNDYHFLNTPWGKGKMQSFSLSDCNKVCHYFNMGKCKHGSKCRYIHGTLGYPQGFDETAASEDNFFSNGSLEELEMEITEILKSRRGNPISIASLPMIYYEKYGKHLQAEGYLTESQRHGKPGYNLTKLLARLRNSIRLIDRPHGQHSVILAEDAPKYIGPRFERNDPGPIVSGSKQIYLTFPAESTFTEEEVKEHFSAFGPVHDVRIPCQQRRMFGFVSFVSADTVKKILSQGNPHYVCGARVLVKPYREKSKLVERKYADKLENPLCYHSHQVSMDPEFKARREPPRMLKQQLIDEQNEALDFESMRLSKLQLAETLPSSQSFFCYPMDERNISQDYSKFPSAQGFNDIFDNRKSSNDNTNQIGSNYFDQDNDHGLNLPDSPFTELHK